MNCKDYLGQTFFLDEQINAKIRLSETLSGQLYGQMSDTSDARHRLYEKIAALEQEINADIDRLVDLKTEMYKMFEKLPDARQRTLLQLRYLTTQNGRRPTWASIARSMCYDERWVMRLHAQALESLQKILDAAQ